MSLYLQATIMRVWAPKGKTPVVRCDPSRPKTCFYGSLDLKHGHEFVMQADQMTSNMTAQYLHALLEALPQPILLLWDRAPWHNGAAIREILAAHPRLEVMLFPVASPELNPQEHVWKDTRQTVTHNHDVAHLKPLAAAVVEHLEHTTFDSSFLRRYGYEPLCTAFK